MSSLNSPTGTRDVLAPESARWLKLIAIFAGVVRRGGYGFILTPMFEDVAVFRRTAGEGSEVVSKEMYEFEDKGGRQLALKPEGTASVVRAYLQHRPPVPYKAWYVTPAFRYERPQAGRFRQHHQLGIEALGIDDPDLDVEVIALLATFFEEVGLSAVTIRVNSMGDEQCLPQYKEALRAYFEVHASSLCDEHQGRYSENPLRVLDCKRPACIAAKESAPRLANALCEPCANHFARVLSGLDSLGIKYVLDDFLVRGFDYYTRTTFEFASSALDAAQNAIGGGGRYDGLAKSLGGPETPGIGFASGIERVLLACDAENVLVEQSDAPEIFVIDLVGGQVARDLTYLLRRAGLFAERAFGQRSLKAQLRQADRLGARLVVIVGEREQAEGVVSIKVLGDHGNESQMQCRVDELVDETRKLLS